MRGKDYLPTKDGDFLTWAQNLYQFALANFTKWNVPSPQTFIQLPLNNFETAFAALADPNHGKVDVERKKEYRAAADKAFRLYVRAYLVSNPAVTDDERVAMGIPVHKTTKTKHPLPESVPELEVDTGTPRVHKVHYHIKGSGRRGKPDHVSGIEIRWAALDHYPQSIEELNHSAFDTASPWENTFDEADRGNRVYYCGRWEVPSEGGKGPFGEIVEAIVA